MRWWLALAVLAQLIDAVTFVIAVYNVGLWGEINPFVHSLYEWYGMPGIMVAKLMLILAVIVASMWRPRSFRLARAVAIFMGITGIITNMYFGVLA